MTGYRLTFGTLHVMASTMVDTIEPAMDSLAAAVGTLSAFAEVLGHDYFIAPGSAQFFIRFAAESDEEAYAAAKVATEAVHAPVDAIKVERRSRSYVPLRG